MSQAAQAGLLKLLLEGMPSGDVTVAPALLAEIQAFVEQHPECTMAAAAAAKAPAAVV